MDQIFWDREVSHGYVPALDVDGDGSIGNVDFNAFANHYQKVWTF